MARRRVASTDEIIAEKHALGWTPTEIAHSLGKRRGANTTLVRSRLAVIGLTPNGTRKTVNKRPGHVRTSEEIDQFILDRPGCAPSELAWRLRIPTPDVRDRLIALGRDPGAAGNTLAKYHVHPMWTDYSDDDRRYAIWRRQRDGARAALMEMQQ